MNIPELPPADFLQVDLFPAKVLLPNGPIDRVRFVVTDAHVHVLRLGTHGDIELEYTADLQSLDRASEVGPRGFRVFTQDGDLIEAHKSYNCGCGMSRIKGARFYDPMPPMRALPFM